MENQIITQTKPALPSLPDSLNSLLKSDSIDWNGEYDFSDKSLPIHRMTGRVMDRMQPVPAVDKQAALQACETVDAATQPATRRDFSVMIYRLSLHCGMKKMNEAESKLYADDLWHDVEHYPLHLIEVACEKWRKSTEDKTRFMPSSGDLIALMYEENAKLQRLKKRAYKLAGIPIMKHEPTKVSEVISRMIEGMTA